MILSLAMIPLLFAGRVSFTPSSSFTSDAQRDQTPPVQQSPIRTSSFDRSHKLWTDVLMAHVSDDSFDYKKLKSDRTQFDQYLKQLEAVTPTEFAALTSPDQFAFWIDAYNAYTVQRVIDAYPIDSIRDLGNETTTVWDQKFIPLTSLTGESKGEKLSLNDIENKILRPIFKDARVHAAINCASKGCPPLADQAFTGARLDEMLDLQVTRWLADPARNRFDHEGNAAELSMIFDWFKDDFVRDAGSVRSWVAKYAPAQERTWLTGSKDLRIAFREYSWKLNDRR